MNFLARLQVVAVTLMAEEYADRVVVQRALADELEYEEEVTL